jgi:hypothetical protein
MSSLISGVTNIVNSAVAGKTVIDSASRVHKDREKVKKTKKHKKRVAECVKKFGFHVHL